MNLSFADEDGDVVDLVAVERAIAGDKTVILRDADRRELMRRMRAAGRSHAEMAAASGMSARHVKRRIKKAEARLG